MRINYIKTFVAALLLTSSAMADTNIGYTNETISTKNNIFRLTSNTDQRLAIRFSPEKLKSLKGRTIKAMRIVFGSKQSQNNQATVFLTSSLDGTPITSKTVTITSTTKFTEITFDRPYTITGEESELFLGCKMTIGASYGAFSADFSTDIQNTAFAYGKDGWEDLYGKGYGAPNIEAVIEGDLSFTDGIIKPFSEDGYVKEGTPLAYTLELQNFGTTTINSFDATVRVGNGTEKTLSFSDCNILPHKTYKFNIDGFAAGNSGQQDINVSINIPNDTDTADNTARAAAYFYPTDMKKNILLEVFTGQTCTNCPGGHQSLESAIQQTGASVVEIGHHAGYVTDIFSMTEDWNLTSLYNGSTYAPAAMFNRTILNEGESTPVMECGSVSSNVNAINSAAKLKPYVSIDLNSNYDEKTREVRVNASVFTHEQMPGEDIRYSIWLLQDGIVAAQAGATSDYVHNNVSRGTITEGSWGESAQFKVGETLNIEKTFSLPDTIVSTSYTKTDRKNRIPTNPENMKIVLFVHQQSSSLVSECRVFNCAETPLNTPAVRTERLLTRQTYYGDNQGYESETTATRTIDYFYNSNNKIIRAVETSKDTNIDNWTLTHYYLYDYDKSGNLTRSNSLQYGSFDYGELGFFAANDTITYEYNAQNQLIRENHPLKYYLYEYNEQGILIKKATWNLNSITKVASNDLVETYSDFNSFGKPCTITATSPSGKEWNEFRGALTYDASGNLIEEKHYESDNTLKYAEYWKYEDGHLTEHRLPTVFGDGTEVDNTKETFAPLDGDWNRVSHTIYVYDGSDKWDKLSGTTCTDEYKVLTSGEELSLTASAVDGEINTAELSINPQSSTLNPQPIIIYRNGIAIDTITSTTTTDFEVPNGTYEYMAVQGNHASNIVSYTHHVDLPCVRNLHFISMRYDLFGGVFAKVGWDNPVASLSELGFISNSLYFVNMQTEESKTEDPDATELEADFGQSTTAQLYIQTRYKFGRANTPVITIDLNNPTGIHTPSSLNPQPSVPEIGFPYVPQGIVIKNGKKHLQQRQ